MEQDKSAYRQRQKLIEDLPNDDDYQRFSDYLEITPFHPDELRGEDLFFQVVDMERSDTRSLTMEGDEQPLVARSPLIKFSDYDNQALPTVHLIGRSPNGWTVCANVHGMSPYFYIEVNPEFGEEHCDTLMEMLENHLMEQYAKENTFYPFTKEPPSRHILDVSMVHNKKNLFFAKTNTDCFVKVTLLKPDYLRSIRDWIEDSTLTDDKWKEAAYKHPQGRFEMAEFPEFTGQWKTFESNLDFILRLVVNKELDGSAWIKLAGSDYIIREGRQKVSNCQVEVDVYYEDVEPLAKSNDSRWNEPAPFKQMSYDLECAAIDEKSFPEPSKDPVINISVVTWDFAKLRNADGTEMEGSIDKPWKKCVFTWGGCAEIPGDKVFNYETEKEMFEAYFKFVHVLQPDYVTGWNTSNFDEPYLLDRAQTLKIPFFAFRSKLLSRPIKKEPITMEFGSGAGKIAKNKLKLKQKRKGKRLTVDESVKILLAKIHREVQGERREELKKMVDNGAPFGVIISAIDSIELEDKEAADLFSDLKQTLADEEAEEEEEKAERVNYNIEWPGTVWMDGLPVVKTFLKKMLRRYTLNAVAADVIGQQKSDMPYDQIPKLFFHGSNSDRRRIASYCIKDSVLAAEIVDKLMAVLNLLEMSRCTHVLQENLMKRGQSIKVFTMIYYYAHHRTNYLVPFHSVKEEDMLDQEEVEGATVIDAVKGFYTVPIATLDFNSLYPTIMRAFNLSYDTYVPKDRLHLFKAEEVELQQSGSYFMTEKHRPGLLPMILTDLVNLRTQVRKQISDTNSKIYNMVLDMRQLAIKVAANSVYGFTGAALGSLPCPEITAAVTAQGRFQIDTAQTYVETTFTIANGYKYNAKVIYGDTDSIMIMFGNPDLETCKILSRQAEKEVSALFRRPNKMEFEKIYFPYLLFAKKRYAGRKFEFTFKNGQEVTTQKQDAKGIETVRRDSIPLTKEVVQKILDTVLVAKEPRVAEDGTLLPADYTPEIQKAVKIAQDVVRDVYLNKIELGKVVITKAYSKERHEYMSPQPHIELAYRMSLRDPLTAPNKGTRVPYVVRKGNKEDKVWQKSEDPIYALRNGIPIDSEYYLEMLRKPLLRIFDPLIGEDQARARIFTGEHTFNRAVAAMTTVPSFLQGDNGVTIHKRNKQCLVCKAVLHRGSNTCKNQAVCIHCSAEKERVAEVFIDKIEAFNDSHVRHDRLKNWCLQCQGDLTAPVGCSNTDCGIYYLRYQYQSEFERARDDMMRFDLSW